MEFTRLCAFSSCVVNERLATFQAKRSFRFAIATLLIILEVVIWVLLVGLPWVRVVVVETIGTTPPTTAAELTARVRVLRRAGA